MFNWLTRLFNHIRYGKLITEDYTGKVVRVYWSVCVHGYDGGSWENHFNCLITVLWDDGKYNIAGPIFVKTEYNYTITPLNSKTGLFHARKRNVIIVANSVAEYKKAKRIKLTCKRMQQSVCSNEAGEVGIVTDYDGTTFSGKTLKGHSWESKEPKRLAASYKDYIEREYDV